MVNYFDRITVSLLGKLVIIFGFLIVSGRGIFWYTASRTDKRDLMDNSVAFITSFSEMIYKSIKHDMISNRREDIRMALESIGATESIKRVSLFNGNGIIRYSSDRRIIGIQADKTSSACVGCHNNPSRAREALMKGNQWTIYAESEGHRVLSFVQPVYNEPDCYTAQCHVHGRDQRVLGVLMIDFPLYPIDMRIQEKMTHTALYTFLFLTVSAAMLYFILWRFVISPLRVVSKGMEGVTLGDLSQVVPHPSNDEIGLLAQTFNLMTNELRTSRRKMETWTQSLEEEVARKTVEIKKTQSKLIQAEKLAALGRLTADIAHEIRNPLSALGGFGRRLQKIATSKKEKEYSDIIVSEVERLERVLRDTLLFSRDPKRSFERLPVSVVVMDSLATYAELCAENSVQILRDFASDNPVVIDKMQLRQAVDNLISNAIDAMPHGGTLAIAIVEEEVNNMRYVAVHVSDTGPGIADDTLPLIFEPFHTTKKIGYGTGLGLSITKKIIEEHGGFIRAKNNVESGMTFSLYFPYQSNEDLMETPCWQFMKCRRDVNNEVICPAYPHFGRACWVVAGTFCEGRVQGTFAQKYEDCRKCEFYQKAAGKET